MFPTGQHRAWNLRYDDLARERAAEARVAQCVSPLPRQWWCGQAGRATWLRAYARRWSIKLAAVMTQRAFRRQAEGDGGACADERAMDDVSGKALAT